MKLRNKRIIILFVLTFLVSSFLILVAYPPRDDFHYSNPEWNGYSLVVDELNIKIAGIHIGYEDILENASNTVLIVVPMLKPDSDYLNFLKNFVDHGGTLFILDDNGYGNDILQALKIEASFIHEGVVNDPVFFYKKPELAKAMARNETEELILLLNYASIISTSKCKILAITSAFSFFDSNLDELWQRNEKEGPLPIVVSCKASRGEVVIFSDPDIISNFSLENSDGLEFIKYLANGKALVFDEKLLAHSLYAEMHFKVLEFLWFLFKWKELFIILISSIFSIILFYIYRGEG